MTRIFTDMVQFVPHYAAGNLKMTRYSDMIRTKIREFVNASQFTILAAMIEAARRRELELETQSRKRKTALAVVPISVKKPKTSYSYPVQKTGEKCHVHNLVRFGQIARVVFKSKTSYSYSELPYEIYNCGSRFQGWLWMTSTH